MYPEFFTLNNVILHGPYALGFDNFSVVPSTHLWRDDVLEQTPHPDYKPNVRRHWEGVTVSLVNIWSHNYFHWLLENLVQLLFLEREKISRILIPPDPARYIWESLELLDVLDLAVQWDGIPTDLEYLYAFGPVRVDGHNYVKGLKKLQETFRTQPGECEEFYISRQHAKDRRIANEDDLFSLLHRKMNGAVVWAEQLSFEKQVSTFGGARLILSSHGSGLANMVWAREGCKVVEIFGEYHNPCYEKLAQDLGFTYLRIGGEAAGDDILAPLDILEKVL